MVNHEGFYGMAEGIVEEDGLRLTTYTYSEDGYRIGLQPRKTDGYTVRRKDCRTGPCAGGTADHIPWTQLSGIQPRSIQETLYRIPEGVVVTEASLHAEKPVVISPETGKCAGNSHYRGAAAFGRGGGVQGLQDIPDPASVP